MIKFLQKEYSEIIIEANRIGEINIFQTNDWIKLISETQNATPIFLSIFSDESHVGFFTGLIIKKFGLKFLGSPFRGWQTYFMGFNLKDDAPFERILEALSTYAFKDLGCNYIEIIDTNFLENILRKSSYKYEDLNYYAIDLTRSEEDLFSNMDHTGRNCIRKSIKNGVTIEEAFDENFADEYYDQYKEVLSRHSLIPAYSLDFVKKMIDILLPTGNLLLLRSKNPIGQCIATGIFVSLNKTAVFWGAASWREFQSLRPNEPLAWYAMKKLKSQGIRTLHFGGTNEHYKKKLGCTDAQLFRVIKSKSFILKTILSVATSPRSEKYRNWVLRKISK